MPGTSNFASILPARFRLHRGAPGLPVLLAVVAIAATACGSAIVGDEFVSSATDVDVTSTPREEATPVVEEVFDLAQESAPPEPALAETTSDPAPSPSPERTIEPPATTVPPSPTPVTSGGFDTSAFAEITPGGPRDVDPDQFRQLFHRDGIVPIYEPLLVSPAETDLTQTELVMGVFINGEARAYPVSQLRRREMVNDELGGIPLLVTW